VQFMPMVAGLIRLARQSGEILSLSAHCVYEFDHWDYELGDNERISHRPRLDGERGKMIAAYAIGKTKSGPWSQWFERMAEKTVIRRLLKRMPTSTDLQRAVDADNETYDLDAKPTIGEQRQALDPRNALRTLVAEPAPVQETVEDDFSDIPFDDPKEAK
jgi:recombination protein RecT